MTRSDEYGPRFFTTAAKGKLCGEDTYAVLIRFPRDMHEELQARAQRANSSYAEQVRLAVEWGLESGDQK